MHFLSCQAPDPLNVRARGGGGGGGGGAAQARMILDGKTLMLWQNGLQHWLCW